MAGGRGGVVSVCTYGIICVCLCQSVSCFLRDQEEKASINYMKLLLKIVRSLEGS